MIRRLTAAVVVLTACGQGQAGSTGAGQTRRGSTPIRLDWVDSIGPLAAREPRLLPDLGRALRDSVPKVQTQAAYWLGQAGAKSVPFLVNALADQRPEVQKAAAYGLGLIGRKVGPSAYRGLTRVLGGVNDSAAGMAAWALEQIGGRAGPVAAGLTTYRFGIGLARYDGLTRLQLLGPAAAPAVPFLIATLAAPDRYAARLAEEALIAVGPIAIPAIELATRNDDQLVKAAATRILTSLRPGL